MASQTPRKKTTTSRASTPRRRTANPRKRKKKRSGCARRFWLWSLVVAVVVGMSAVLGVKVCRFRPMLHTTSVPAGATLDGIDVSHFQNKVDWDKVSRNEAIQFVIVKATEGASIQDKHFKVNVKMARKAGLHVGAYHLYSPKSTPEKQFENFRKQTLGADCDLIPCIDVEEDVSRDNLKANVMRLIALMEKHYGCKPLLYVNAHVYNDYLYPEARDCELWIPSYSRKPKPKDAMRPYVWQYSKTGRLPGIKGHVDLNCFVNGMTVERLLLKR